MKVPALSLGIAAAALALAFTTAPAARSQGVPPGGMPSKAEIEKRIQEELDKLEDKTSEVEGVKLTYKPIPANPVDVIKASGQVPPGVDPDQAAKQFGPMAKPYIEKYMRTMDGVTCEYRSRLFHTIRDLTADSYGAGTS